MSSGHKTGAFVTLGVTCGESLTLAQCRMCFCLGHSVTGCQNSAPIRHKTPSDPWCDWWRDLTFTYCMRCFCVRQSCTGIVGVTHRRHGLVVLRGANRGHVPVAGAGCRASAPSRPLAMPGHRMLLRMRWRQHQANRVGAHMPGSRHVWQHAHPPWITTPCLQPQAPYSMHLENLKLPFSSNVIASAATGCVGASIQAVGLLVTGYPV